jgi:hypothetical protein
MFISAETTDKREDRIAERDHVECAWGGGGDGSPNLWATYRYDVAGVEFLTPVVMATGIFIAYSVT